MCICGQKMLLLQFSFDALQSVPCVGTVLTVSVLAVIYEKPELGGDLRLLLHVQGGSCWVLKFTQSNRYYSIAWRSYPGRKAF